MVRENEAIKVQTQKKLTFNFTANAIKSHSGI